MADAPVVAPGPRVGIGYDSHRFEASRQEGCSPAAGRPLILGGVRFPGSPGLGGFSDGDAVAHAVIDALLGAAALGDIGTHFPPGEEEWRNADSMKLLSRAILLVRESGWRAGNVDVTVVCEAPPIAPRAAQMRAALAARLGIRKERVSVKGKSNEGMGWIGRGEGIAVFAVATLAPTPRPSR